MSSDINQLFNTDNKKSINLNTEKRKKYKIVDRLDHSSESE